MLNVRLSVCPRVRMSVRMASLWPAAMGSNRILDEIQITAPYLFMKLTCDYRRRTPTAETDRPRSGQSQDLLRVCVPGLSHE